LVDRRYRQAASRRNADRWRDMAVRPDYPATQRQGSARKETPRCIGDAADILGEGPVWCTRALRTSGGMLVVSPF
jgi:hypothetical protein